MNAKNGESTPELCHKVYCANCVKVIEELLIILYFCFLHFLYLKTQQDETLCLIRSLYSYSFLHKAGAFTIVGSSSIPHYRHYGEL